ncbi:2-haloacid dehalogenase [Methylopila capsulata]|nr:haloacid dehalogenase type II [Methylopila capsulata]MBM7850636.1 2-haloacid dehalogenase [Methylopila capsulata]
MIGASEPRDFPVYVFDAYGTLFDVHSATMRHRELIGPDAQRLSDLWRTKQLEYAWVYALMGAYRDFWSLTEAALDVAGARIGGLSAEARRALLAAYLELSTYPEAKDVLRKLKAQGAKTAILSNGSPDMLTSAVAAAGLADLLDATLSVDGLMTYKTDPRAYRLAQERFAVAPHEISFQSSNRWDVAGAAAFGFRAVWVNRTEAPDEYADFPPARRIADLSGLLAR